MKTNRMKNVGLVCLAVALCSGSLAPVRADEPRVVEMIADKDNKWKLPDGSKVLNVKAGEQIHFKITSLFGGEKARDFAVHSFVIRKLRNKGWSIRLKEGVREFTLTMPPPGTHLIECTVECGPGHDTMNIKMVVAK